MIGFATLFLGLLLGPHNVELLADEQVAAVEILLDGAVVARLEDRPFAAEIDFGDTLEPHHLEAVALDEAGQEVERTEQWINLPRPPAEVTVVLVEDDAGLVRRAQVAWKALEYEEPQSVAVSLDGRRLTVEDPRDFALPGYDANQLHLLKVEVIFDNSLSASSEVTFGGFYADEVSSEITAVPVDMKAFGAILPQAGQRSSSFRVGGEPLLVAGVEKGPAEVLFVRDANAKDALIALHPQYGRNIPLSLGKDHRLRVLWATPQIREVGESQHALFPRSADLEASDGELYWYLSRLVWPTNAASQKVADAVAVGGMAAAARNRRRAVVLLLGPRRDDAALLEPSQVRGYLKAMRVPLHVWSTHPKEWQGNGWGDVEDVSTIWKLARATRRLRRALEQQRIVWLEGEHLPQQIEVGTGASGR
ncbi:MAG: hypothetical protein AAGA81_25380 [Acidobacteriota bacterium]